MVNGKRVNGKRKTIADWELRIVDCELRISE